MTTVPMIHGETTSLPMMPREGGVEQKDCMSRDALGGPVAVTEPEDAFCV